MGLRLGSLGRLALVACPLVLLAAGCSSSSVTASDPGAEGGTTGPGSSPDGTDGGVGSDDAPPPNDCKIVGLLGASEVAPTFFTFDPPRVGPPPMTGGTLNGKYRVDKATVYLPTQSKDLADPTKSTGAVTAWAVFSGKDYRIFLRSTFTISSVIGPQSQGSDVASQGGFTVNAASLTLDHACDKVAPQEAEYTFSDNGSGRATILVKTPSTYGDTFLLLEAAKN